jgi:hypothetical protein
VNGKNQPDQSGEYGRCSSVVAFFFAKKILDQNRPVCWSIVVKEKPNAGSPFLWAFPSDHIPKATKDLNAHFFIHSRNSCKLLPATSGNILNLLCTYSKFSQAQNTGATTLGKLIAPTLSDFIVDLGLYLYYLYIKGAQIPGATSPKQLHFVQWRLIFVGP